MTDGALLLAGLCLLGYGLGAIPFGLLLTRAAGLGDIRAIGSGNIGATNVLRTGRKELAAATLLLDAAKGALAVVIGVVTTGAVGALVAGLGAMLGHLFPVWLRFRGGKGVATGLGMTLAAWPPAGLAACGVWLTAAAVTRVSSLGALSAFVAAPLIAWSSDAPPEILALIAIAAVLVWARHHANIRRLLAGREPRIGGGT